MYAITGKERDTLVAKQKAVEAATQEFLAIIRFIAEREDLKDVRFNQDTLTFESLADNQVN